MSQMLNQFTEQVPVRCFASMSSGSVTVVYRSRMCIRERQYLSKKNILAWMALVITVAVLGGCQSPAKKSGPLLLFPPPPEKPRIQFLTWVSGAEQVTHGVSSLESFVLGEESIDRRRLNKPYAMAVHDGVAYVCDTKGLSLVRMDFKNGTYTLMGTNGPGRLRKPINITIDPLGFKFVADPVRKQIVIFSPEDEYVSAFNVPEPCHPVDVAIYENEIFVLDNDSTPQIVVLNRQTGEMIRAFGEDGSDAGQFHIPGSLAVSVDGFLYVSDTMNWRVQKLTRQGEVVWAKGTPGYRLGQYGRPRGIRVGPDGVVFLVDGATEIVQMLSAEGELLMHFGGAGNAPGALYLPSSLAVDKSSIPYFKKYIHEKFEVEYLLFVVNQYGDYLINVYAFGKFPKGFRLDESSIGTLPAEQLDTGIGPVDGPLPPIEEGPADHPQTKLQEPSKEPG